MKKLFFFLGIILNVKLLFAQCIVPTELSKAYADDAKAMAFYRTILDKTSEIDSIAISATLQNEIMECLAAIYKERNNIPDIDSIFNIYCIHTAFNHYYNDQNLITVDRNTLELNQVYVKLDTTVAWAKNLINGIQPTGNLGIDNLLKDYKIQVKRFLLLPSIATLTFDKIINTIAMSKRLAAFQGVVLAEGVSKIGDGNFISYLKFNDKKQMVFSIGMGDCPSGCTSRIEWWFDVAPDCSIKLKEKRISNDITNANLAGLHLNCKQFISNKDISSYPKINMFPNPSLDVLNITKGDEVLINRIVISNILGMTLYDKAYSSRIELNNLPKGVLVVQCYDAQQKIVTTQRILHQNE